MPRLKVPPSIRFEAQQSAVPLGPQVLARSTQDGGEGGVPPTPVPMLPPVDGVPAAVALRPALELDAPTLIAPSESNG